MCFCVCVCVHDCPHAVCVLSFLKQITVLQQRGAGCWIPAAKSGEQQEKAALSLSHPPAPKSNWNFIRPQSLRKLKLAAAQNQFLFRHSNARLRTFKRHEVQLFSHADFISLSGEDAIWETDRIKHASTGNRHMQRVAYKNSTKSSIINRSTMFSALCLLGLYWENRWEHAAFSCVISEQQ